ncbi:alpha/beta fold hydrolase [Ornithinimicrobium sp. Arc0846-15]|nr:alpha/beta fold hydrolase [Ornithinimicrobium laminariae]
MQGAEPFKSAGDGANSCIGVLVIHGLTSTPQSMSPIFEALAASGYAVSAPLLPGHGTTWQDMNTTRYADWLVAVREAATELRESCDTLIVVGMSLGGALASDLAAGRPDLVDAVVLINPAFAAEDPRLVALPVIKHVLPTLPGLAGQIRRPDGPQELAYDRLPLKAFHSFVRRWDGLARDLVLLKQPVLLLRSAHDDLVPLSSANRFLSNVGSDSVRQVWLPNSGHVATLDYDQELLLEEVISFVGTHG